MIWLSIKEALSNTIRGRNRPIDSIEILDTDEKKDNSLTVLIVILALSIVGALYVIKK